MFGGKSKAHLRKGEMQRGFVWDFGYIHGNSKQEKQREIEIIFQNIGGTDLEWRFQVDDESQFHMKRSLEANELEFDKTLFEKQFFSFKPKRGKLEPYQTQKILVTYHPFQEEEFSSHNKERSNEEEHQLDAFIRIQNGKSIRLALTGKTLSNFQGKLVLKSDRIILPTLPINLACPVEVPVGLQNIGSNNLRYKVNKKKLLQEYSLNKAEKIIDFANEDSTL